MFSPLARGFGTWTGDLRLELPKDRKLSLSLPSLVENEVPHRHGITVSPKLRSPSPPSSARGEKPDGEIVLPKTFVTRRGALVLFVGPEDLHLSERDRLLLRKHMILAKQREATSKLGTLDRLAKAVLLFGSHNYDGETASLSEEDQCMVLKFLHELDEGNVDLHSKPGGDVNFYLRDLKSRTSSRWTSRASTAVPRCPVTPEGSPYRMSPASQRGASPQLISADPSKLAEQYTQPASQTGVRSAADDRPQVASPKLRIMSTEQLTASLKSATYLGRPITASSAIKEEDAESQMSRRTSTRATSAASYKSSHMPSSRSRVSSGRSASAQQPEIHVSSSTMPSRHPSSSAATAAWVEQTGGVPEDGNDSVFEYQDSAHSRPASPQALPVTRSRSRLGLTGMGSAHPSSMHDSQYHSMPDSTMGSQPGSKQDLARPAVLHAAHPMSRSETPLDMPRSSPLTEMSLAMAERANTPLHDSCPGSRQSMHPTSNMASVEAADTPANTTEGVELTNGDADLIASAASSVLRDKVVTLQTADLADVVTEDAEMMGTGDAIQPDHLIVHQNEYQDVLRSQQASPFDGPDDERREQSRQSLHSPRGHSGAASPYGGMENQDTVVGVGVWQPDISIENQDGEAGVWQPDFVMGPQDTEDMAEVWQPDFNAGDQDTEGQAGVWQPGDFVATQPLMPQYTDGVGLLSSGGAMFSLASTMELPENVVVEDVSDRIISHRASVHSSHSSDARRESDAAPIEQDGGAGAASQGGSSRHGSRTSSGASRGRSRTPKPEQIHEVVVPGPEEQAPEILSEPLELKSDSHPKQPPVENIPPSTYTPEPELHERASSVSSSVSGSRPASSRSVRSVHSSRRGTPTQANRHAAPVPRPPSPSLRSPVDENLIQTAVSTLDENAHVEGEEEGIREPSVKAPSPTASSHKAESVKSGVLEPQMEVEAELDDKSAVLEPQVGTMEEAEEEPPVPDEEPSLPPSEKDRKQPMPTKDTPKEVPKPASSKETSRTKTSAMPKKTESRSPVKPPARVPAKKEPVPKSAPKKESPPKKQYTNALDISSVQPESSPDSPAKATSTTSAPQELRPESLVRDTQAELVRMFGFVPPTVDIKSSKTPKKSKKRTEKEIEEAHKKLEQQVNTILDSSEVGDGEGGISLEEMELEQQILKQKIEQAEEKIKGGKGGGKKDSPRQKDKKNKKKDKEEAKLDLAKQREAIREAKRQEKLRRLEEAKLLQSKIKEKEKMKQKALAAAKEKEQLMKEQMLSAEEEAEEARRAEEEARQMLQEARKAAREERDARRKAEIERKKEEAARRREGERKRMEAAREREQSMLEKIADAEQRRLMAEQERFQREEDERLEQERLEEEEKEAQKQAEEEEERLAELERQAEEEAMARLIREREEADERRLQVQRDAKRAKEEEERRKLQLLEEERLLEIERLRQEALEEKRQEEERMRLIELQRMEEEARNRMRVEMEKRREIALARREVNLDRRNHLRSLSQGQGMTKPWVFSYYVLWPRETYDRPIGGEEDPKKKRFRSAPAKPKPKPEAQA